MAVKSSADVGFLLIGGYSVLSTGGPVTDIKEEASRIVEQIDGLSESTDRWGDVGQQVWQMEQDGFYNIRNSGLHEALEAASPHVLLYAPVGNAIGNVGIAVSGVRTIYARLPKRGEHHKARAIYRAGESGGPETFGRQHINADWVARTALGPTDLTAVNFGAATTNGGALYLAVTALALDGGTSVTVSVRHSTDNFAASNDELGAFTNVTAANTAERIGVTGTVRQYTRVRYVFNGAAGAARSITFAVIVGRK